MKLLGIDFGKKRIGIAVTDEKGEFAFPYIVLENNKTVIEAIKKIIEKEKVKKIILGLPLDLENRPTHSTAGAENFKLELEKAIVVPVIFEKEFYTTKEAERVQGKIKKIDASAAALILKHYIENGGATSKLEVAPPPFMNPYLSVIIPTYNEEKTIAETVGKILSYLKKQNFSFEILVADDGSKDNTVEIVKQKFADDLKISVIERKENHGKGYTVREGMLKAKGTVRLFMDADNSTDISHFDLMKPLFDGGYDVVIGSRDEKDAKGARKLVSQVWYKTLLGNMANLFIQIIGVWGIWDTQCGFKAFTMEAAEKIFGLAKTDRWAFDVEALALARIFKYKIGIIPVQWIDNPNSRVKISGYIKALLEVIKIKSYVRSLKKQLILKKVAA